MTLEIGYEDLKDAYKNCNPSQTKFNKFKESVQAAIRIVGEAMFYNGDRTNHNVIYPPQKRRRSRKA